jgi:hypothetical protein
MESESELLALLVELDGFERQQNISSKFNIFEALNITRAEIRHSRFLAYLLDPAQSHGLGDKFLRMLIQNAAQEHTELPFARLQFAIADYSDARVYCERDHFDITVEVPSLKLLFVIENKIGSSESEDQLRGYRNKAKSLYPEFEFFGCFLTVEGYEGEDQGWASLSYGVVAETLAKLIATVQLTVDIKIAIEHYIEVIGKRIMPSKEFIDACKKIYQQHRTALDLIYQYGSESPLEQAYAIFQANHPSLGKPLVLREGYLSFIPDMWAKIGKFDVSDRARWEAPCPIKFWFSMNETKVYLKLEVGPVDSSKHFDRSAFISALRNELDVKESRRTGEIFTRILNKSEKIEEEFGTNELAGKLETLWERIQGDKLTTTVQRLAVQHVMI